LDQKDFAKVKIEISVLSPLARASHEDVRPEVHGVYVKSGRRSGTYLPQVWEHFKKKEEFLTSLCEDKAGLPGGAWKDGSAELYTYTVTPFTEK